jgi:hypothetical protein
MLHPLNYIKVEANLENIGLFIPSSKNSSKILVKRKTQMKIIDGQKIETSIEIIGSQQYGLPKTIDQDIFYAFMEILNNIYAFQEKLPQPIGFKSEEIIKLMGKKRNGRLTKKIEDWLYRMASITIRSRGVIYLADKKIWATDVFHIFDRVIAYGERFENGKRADQNYVWLSDWFRTNYERLYCYYLDHEFHKRLRKPLAKALRPLLNIAFYASDGEPVTKRYDELCKEFNIRPYKSLSKIKEKLEPAHQELKREKFLDHMREENPKYEKTKDGLSYNITWYSGERFFQEKLKRDLKRMAFIETAKESSEKNRELVDYFHQRLNHKNHQPTNKELQQANYLIEKYGFEKAKTIVDWVIKDAKKTNFLMSFFGAVLSKESEAIIEIEKEEWVKKQKEEEMRKIKEERRKAEEERRIFESKPIEEKVEIMLERWLLIQKMLKRDPSETEIEQKRKDIETFLTKS